MILTRMRKAVNVLDRPIVKIAAESAKRSSNRTIDIELLW